MLTVFRCLTDGCSSVDGTPLLIHVVNVEGVFSTIAIAVYVICTVFVIFGLFNLIMAIFVETTMANAQAHEYTRRMLKEQEDNRTAVKLKDIITSLFVERVAMSPKSFEKEHSTELLNMNPSVDLTKFLEVVGRKDVQKLLDDLDIKIGNRFQLFEILDANGDGVLECSELVKGLLKLRGGPQKSDAVASVLISRSIQQKLTT